MDKSQWFIDWTDQPGFGVAEMDAADRRLFAQVNTFNEAIVNGRHEQAIHYVFDKLMQDASLHFRHEEQFFSQVGYPLLKGHAALHRQMTAELRNVKEELRRTEDRATWMECGLLVRQLFVDHTLRETKVYRSLPRTGDRA